jgi:hypothetical protein
MYAKFDTGTDSYQVSFFRTSSRSHEKKGKSGKVMYSSRLCTVLAGEYMHSY